MVLMSVVGFLVGKGQPRTLIALGLLIEAFALYHMSQLSLQMAYSDVVWARIIQASGLAFVFVPITTVAYVGLPPGKNNNASALINLMRNLGGSFGISLAQTWLARRSPSGGRRSRTPCWSRCRGRPQLRRSARLPATPGHRPGELASPAGHPGAHAGAI
jgi:hypothetical protein